MIDTLTFFENADDLTKLTGLDERGLWDNDFDLDDFDWGFCLDTEYDEIATDEDYPEITCRVVDFNKYLNNEVPPYIYRLFSWMDNYCCGYKHTEYDGKHYYMLYHG